MSDVKKPLGEVKWRFILEQGHKWMDGQVNAFDAVTGRAANLLGIMLTLLPVLVGLGTVAREHGFMALFHAAVVYTLVSIIAIVLLVFCLLLRKLVFSGRPPLDYIEAGIGQKELEDVFAEECKQCQDYITNNQSRLDNVVGLYKGAVAFLMCGVLASVVVAVICSFLTF